MTSHAPTSASLDPLGFKPDFAQSVQRFEAWWEREIVDRPPVTVRVAPSRPYDGPVVTHADYESRWFDAEYQVDRAIAELARRNFLGDTLPYFRPGIGPELTSTPLGAQLVFGDTTSWSIPQIESPQQWAEVAERSPDFGNRYWQIIERETRLAIDKCNGRYLVAVADLHGNYDILAGLREPEMLCLDLMDYPELVNAAAQRAAETFVACFERHYRMIVDAGIPTTHWIPMYHRGANCVVSCDFWCMLGEQHAREFVLPLIRSEMRPLEKSIFHLDGPQALRHLDLLLDLDDLDAIQWVYGAGAGPAARWINVYHRILDRNKSVQVLAESAGDALTVLDAIGPTGVWLDVQSEFNDADAAERFISEVSHRSTHHSSN